MTNTKILKAVTILLTSATNDSLARYAARLTQETGVWHSKCRVARLAIERYLESNGKGKRSNAAEETANKEEYTEVRREGRIKRYRRSSR